LPINFPNCSFDVDCVVGVTGNLKALVAAVAVAAITAVAVAVAVVATGVIGVVNGLASGAAGEGEENTCVTRCAGRGENETNGLAIVEDDGVKVIGDDACWMLAKGVSKAFIAFEISSGATLDRLLAIGVDGNGDVGGFI
jgi:hypothetical protein